MNFALPVLLSFVFLAYAIRPYVFHDLVFVLLRARCIVPLQQIVDKAGLFPVSTETGFVKTGDACYTVFTMTFYVNNILIYSEICVIF